MTDAIREITDELVDVRSFGFAKPRCMCCVPGKKLHVYLLMALSCLRAEADKFPHTTPFDTNFLWKNFNDFWFWQTLEVSVTSKVSKSTDIDLSTGSINVKLLFVRQLIGLLIVVLLSKGQSCGFSSFGHVCLGFAGEQKAVRLC